MSSTDLTTISKVKVIDFYLNLLSLSLSLLKFEEHKRRIDQGFPHIGVCPWLVPHLSSSCLGLSFAIYVYVLSAVYFNVDVIANLEKILS